MDALAVAEKLRRLSRNTLPRRRVPAAGRFTISVGVATYPEDARTVLENVRAADKALYLAKDAGRNLASQLTSAPGRAERRAAPRLVRGAAP